MIALATIAFNKPWLIEQQIRLLRKYLEDDWTLTVFDNSDAEDEARGISLVCAGAEIAYERISVPEHLHSHALDKAAAALLASGSDYFGFLDHDVFPSCPVRLQPMIAKAGFYGIGQRHSPTDSLYIWPGFFFLSTAWLNGRRLNFDGIRGNVRADDGDCGSMNASLFSEEDWQNVYRSTHGYRLLRAPDDYGLQSFGYEVFDDCWIHLSNGSGWMQVPDFADRERLALELLSSL